MSKLSLRALLLAVPVALSPLGSSPAQAHHADTTGSCQIPSHIECEMSDLDGIARIVVEIPGPNGDPVTVVDKSFSRCPEQATVSWDPITPGHNVTVYDCSTDESPEEPDATFAARSIDTDGDGRADRVVLRRL